MKITSPAFDNNADIPSKYTCDGENINPELTFIDIPTEANSLALIMDDPDAPGPGGFVHWIIFNINPKTTQISENSVPASAKASACKPQNAVQGQNSSGESKYTSPCPPSGTHRYFFKLFALDSLLDLDSKAKREDVEKAVSGHVIDQAELIGLYKRN